MPRKERPPAYQPAEWDDRIAYAFKNLYKGEATAEEQGLVVQWLLGPACGVDELSFRSDSEGGGRETDFAEGRRFVGLQIKKLIHMPMGVVAKVREKRQNG